MRSSTAIPSHWKPYLAILLSIAILLWLPFEDNSESQALIFAVALSTLLTTRYLPQNNSNSTVRVFRHLAIGGLAGAAVTPIALLLMVFKTGIHGHGISDYSTEQIVHVVLITPVWIIVGIIAGLGSAIVNYRLGMDKKSNK
jgi:hypothetical protein